MSEGHQEESDKLKDRVADEEETMRAARAYARGKIRSIKQMAEREKETSASAFRAPGSTEWRQVNADTSDKDLREEAGRASDELKSMLVVSMQMQYVVVLAGLGCSRSADGPTMDDLWIGAVGEEPTENAVAASKKVRHDLKDRNIEAFLSRIEAFLQVNEDNDVTEFLNSCKQVILDRCSAFLRPEKLSAHKTFLHRLSRRRMRDQRLRLFTTNYDLCFEMAASEVGGVVLDGFSFTAPRRYDPRYFGYDIIRRPRSGDDLGNYLEGVFLLYKLHGSVNWAKDEDGAIHEKSKPKPAEACLIYPARGKYQQSFVQPHLESMAQYLASVREPNTCLLVIGFGLRDDHLAEPLLSAVQSNPHLRLIVVDPSAREKACQASGDRYWPRLFELAGRGEDVWFVNASFEDFAQMIPDLKSLTPAENLMRAIKGVTRDS